MCTSLVPPVAIAQELPHRLHLDAVRGLKNIKEAALDLTLSGTDVTKTGGSHFLAVVGGSIVIDLGVVARGVCLCACILTHV